MWGWLEAFARANGLRHEAEVDERWLRAFEPYATLRTPHRYEHSLSSTGAGGSLTLARAVVPFGAGSASTWVAIVQDPRVAATVATTSDFGSPFAEPLDLVAWRRRGTGDPAFDHVFASFVPGAAASDPAASEAPAPVPPSVRRLLLSWRAPVHAELRPGSFILAPVSVPADARGLTWLLEAVRLLGEKATKVATRV